MKKLFTIAFIFCSTLGYSQIFNNSMFALKGDTILIGKSPIFSNHINLVEKIYRKNCEELYFAVAKLTFIACYNDEKSYKQADMLCHKIYKKIGI